MVGNACYLRSRAEQRGAYTDPAVALSYLSQGTTDIEALTVIGAPVSPAGAVERSPVRVGDVVSIEDYIALKGDDRSAAVAANDETYRLHVALHEAKRYQRALARRRRRSAREPTSP